MKFPDRGAVVCKPEMEPLPGTVLPTTRGRPGQPVPTGCACGCPVTLILSPELSFWACRTNLRAWPRVPCGGFWFSSHV